MTNCGVVNRVQPSQVDDSLFTTVTEAYIVVVLRSSMVCRDFGSTLSWLWPFVTDWMWYITVGAEKSSLHRPTALVCHRALCALQSVVVLPPYLHSATYEMWWSQGMWILTELSLCYSVVYYYNGALWYEQFLRTGLAQSRKEIGTEWEGWQYLVYWRS